MTAMLTDLAATYGTTVDTLVSASGFSSLDEYIESALADFDADTLIQSELNNLRGTYTVKENKIRFITDSNDDEADENAYVLFTVSQEKLTLDLPEEAKNEGENNTMFSSNLLPLEFTRK